MAFKVIWTESAKVDRLKILEYWKMVTGNHRYGRLLNQQFKEVTKLIAAFPRIGKVTEDPSVRVKGVDVYQLYYEIDGKTVTILAVWDPRKGDVIY
jgi:plasmid stabilization system protein ParE